MTKSLESLFSLEDDCIAEQVLPSLGADADQPVFDSAALDETIEVASLESFLSTSFETLSIMAKKNVMVSNEALAGIFAHISEFIKKILTWIDTVWAQFTKWVGNSIFLNPTDFQKALPKIGEKEITCVVPKSTDPNPMRLPKISGLIIEGFTFFEKLLGLISAYFKSNDEGASDEQLISDISAAASEYGIDPEKFMNGNAVEGIGEFILNAKSFNKPLYEKLYASTMGTANVIQNLRFIARCIKPSPEWVPGEEETITVTSAVLNSCIEAMKEFKQDIQKSLNLSKNFRNGLQKLLTEMAEYEKSTELKHAKKSVNVVIKFMGNLTKNVSNPMIYTAIPQYKYIQSVRKAIKSVA